MYGLLHAHHRVKALEVDKCTTYSKDVLSYMNECHSAGETMHVSYRRGPDAGVLEATGYRVRVYAADDGDRESRACVHRVSTRCKV